jgi:acetoin:2,6-dichlorophenolindophenol oxidoreductase subunit alpha
MPEIAEFLPTYRAMLRIRKVEERLSALHKAGDIPGFIHSSIGQESVAVGVSRHLRKRDTIAVTHRGHAQSIAKGLALAGLFAELMGREAGVCRGLGGSMHIADSSIGLLGANGIVGGSLPIAAGSALAHKLDGDGNTAVAYFGEASSTNASISAHCGRCRACFSAKTTAGANFPRPTSSSVGI